MSEWTLDPWPWIEGTSYGEGGRDPDHGLFHVTTRADAVRESGGLKARRDLGGIEALGGGVSFTYDKSRALWLYGAIHATALAARGEIDPIEYVGLIFEWTGFPDDIWGEIISGYEDEVTQIAEAQYGNSDQFDRHHVEDGVLVTTLGGATFVNNLMRDVDYYLWDICRAVGIPEHSYVRREPLSRYSRGDWATLIAQNESSIREHLSTGAAMYSLVQTFETVLQHNIESLAKFEDKPCMPVVGFTASFEKFSRIDPDQVTVLQCKARLGARVDFEPAECELRFAPKDVLVVRYGVERDGALPLPDDEEAAE